VVWREILSEMFDRRLPLVPFRSLRPNGRMCVSAVESVKRTRKEDPMPNVAVSDDTYRELCELAAARNVSVEEFIGTALGWVANSRIAIFPKPIPPPLTGEAQRAVLDAMRRDAEARAGQYPPGFVLDDSRETMYREREDAQL
jgi:hypothetical protein